MISPGGARGVEKAELNGNVDSDYNHGGFLRTYPAECERSNRRNDFRQRAPFVASNKIASRDLTNGTPFQAMVGHSPFPVNEIEVVRAVSHCR
jgi:hypothetical protein